MSEKHSEAGLSDNFRVIAHKKIRVVISISRCNFALYSSRGIAEEFRTTHGVLATTEKPWRASYKALSGRGAEAVIVTVGAIPAYQDAPKLLGRGGKVIMVGMPHSGAMAEFEPVMLAAMGQGMVGSKMSNVVIQRDIPWMVDMYDQGRLKLDELISGQ